MTKKDESYKIDNDVLYTNQEKRVIERMKYEQLAGKPNISEIQDYVLNFWKENKVFEKSVEKESKGEKVFYDGPPLPTGKPHHGTILVSFIKDLIARYQTMRGYKARHQ